MSNHNTLDARQALRLPAEVAVLWSGYGYEAAQLPKSLHCGVDDYGLRNADGEWITSLTKWFEHDARVLEQYKERLILNAKRREQFPDLFDVNGD